MAEADEPRPPIVVRPEAAETLEVGPTQVRFLVGSEHSAGFSMIQYTAAPGFAPPPILHRHTREHAAFYVLDGEIEVTFEDRAETLGPGCFVLLPPGCWFRWRNASEERPASWLNAFAPAGFEQFFRDVHAAIEREGPSFDPAKLPEILGPLRARYGDEEHPEGHQGGGP